MHLVEVLVVTRFGDGQPIVVAKQLNKARGRGVTEGGVHLLQMLNILEHFPISELGAGSADKIHLLVEVMRLAYADRSKHLGDPDFYDVPVEWLTGKDYGDELASTISATSSPMASWIVGTMASVRPGH